MLTPRECFLVSLAVGSEFSHVEFCGLARSRGCGVVMSMKAAELVARVHLPAARIISAVLLWESTNSILDSHASSITTIRASMHVQDVPTHSIVGSMGQGQQQLFEDHLYT